MLSTKTYFCKIAKRRQTKVSLRNIPKDSTQHSLSNNVSFEFTQLQKHPIQISDEIRDVVTVFIFPNEDHLSA